MGAIENLQKLQDKKRQEIASLEMRLREAQAYLQALQDSIKVLSREAGEPVEGEQELRPGTLLAQTRDILRKAGKPLHVNELLKLLGRDLDKKTRVSLSGSLSGYVRNQQIFTRPAPNTFGLIEFELPENHPKGGSVPETFGITQ